MSLQVENILIKSLDNFILYRPSEIITGDFYWSKNIHNYLVYCVGDFSISEINGHELRKKGIEILEDITNNFEKAGSNLKISASDITRELIIKLNSYFSVESEDKIKTLNISLAVIDFNSDNDFYNIQLTGINNPLYFVKNKKLDTIDDSVMFYEKSTMSSNLYEIKANDFNVENINTETSSIANHQIKLQKGDVLYLLSDGLINQLGGPFGKKFSDSQLKNIIIDMTDNDIEDQKYVLDYAFELWKGDYPQIDDICIIGLKL